MIIIWVLLVLKSVVGVNELHFCSRKQAQTQINLMEKVKKMTINEYSCDKEINNCDYMKYIIKKDLFNESVADILEKDNLFIHENYNPSQQVIIGKSNIGIIKKINCQNEYIMKKIIAVHVIEYLEVTEENVYFYKHLSIIEYFLVFENSLNMSITQFDIQRKEAIVYTWNRSSPIIFFPKLHRTYENDMDGIIIINKTMNLKPITPSNYSELDTLLALICNGTDCNYQEETNNLIEKKRGKDNFLIKSIIIWIIVTVGLWTIIDKMLNCLIYIVKNNKFNSNKKS